MAQRSISLEDIKTVPEAFAMVVDKRVDDFYITLFDIGFDTEKDIVLEKCVHRPLVHNNEVETYRWVGTERRDAAWMTSEWCTMENRLEVAGMKDPGFQRELIRMSRLPNFTQMIIDHVNGESDSNVPVIKQKAGVDQ